MGFDKPRKVGFIVTNIPAKRDFGQLAGGGEFLKGPLGNPKNCGGFHHG